MISTFQEQCLEMYGPASAFVTGTKTAATLGLIDRAEHYYHNNNIEIIVGFVYRRTCSLSPKAGKLWVHSPKPIAKLITYSI